MINKLIVITGPTASGKSDIALQLAKEMKTEIISCDSQQVYKYMDIGTNKVSKNELNSVKHHLLNVINPDENFDVTDFCLLAQKQISRINGNGLIPIMTGGTGFYIDSILYKPNYGETPKSLEIRKKYNEIIAIKGRKYLHDKLMEIDPQTGVKYHFNEINRIIRALEIFDIRGKKPSELRNGNKLKNENISPLIFCLNYQNRQYLYEKINDRVMIMLKDGLIDEVSKIIDNFKLDENSQSMKAIGYKETFEYLNDHHDYEKLAYDIKINTRHYAKRQITWMKKYSRDFENCHNIVMDNFNTKNEVVQYIKKIIQEESV